MRHVDVPRTQPTSAERVRSILAAAESMTIVTAEERTVVSRVATPGFTEQIHLRPLMPEPSGTATGEAQAGPADPEDAAAGRERAAAVLEFTDISPVPVRDRVRARVTVSGRLLGVERPDGSRSMEFENAYLETAAGGADVSLDELTSARVDPLAICEAGMLTHMVDQHRDLTGVLMRLVQPRHSQGVVRAMPLAIDRYGLTLRLEYARGHHDTRLAFPTALDTADQTGVQVHALLAAARRTNRRNRLFSDS